MSAQVGREGQEVERSGVTCVRSSEDRGWRGSLYVLLVPSSCRKQNVWGPASVRLSVFGPDSSAGRVEVFFLQGTIIFMNPPKKEKSHMKQK